MDILSSIPDPADDVLVHSHEPLFQQFIGEIQTAGDLVKFQMMDAMVRVAEEQRLEQNRKLAEMAKAWKAVKGLHKDRILKLLDAEGTITKSGGRSIKTMLGTIYRHEDKEWSANIEDKTLAMRAIADHADGLGSDAIDMGLIRLVTELTDEGKTAAKELAIMQAQASGESPEWATVSAPGAGVRLRFAKKPSPATLDEQMVSGMSRSLHSLQAPDPNAIPGLEND